MRSLMVCALVWAVPTGAWLVAPAARLARPAGIRGAARVHLCADGEKVQAMVGGRPISEGEGLLARDDESNAWWRATVKQIRGSEVLIHYTGAPPTAPRRTAHTSRARKTRCVPCSSVCRLRQHLGRVDRRLVAEPDAHGLDREIER